MGYRMKKIEEENKSRESEILYGGGGLPGFKC